MSVTSNLWIDLQPDAHKEAELEVRRLQDLQREEKRRREEQLEKARLRGRQALRREQLVQVQFTFDLMVIVYLFKIIFSTQKQ